MSKYLTLLYIS